MNEVTTFLNETFISNFDISNMSNYGTSNVSSAIVGTVLNFNNSINSISSMNSISSISSMNSISSINPMNFNSSMDSISPMNFNNSISSLNFNNSISSMNSSSSINSTSNSAMMTGSCLNAFDPSSDLNLFEFATNGVLLNLVGLLGIVGNILSMVILSRPQMKSSVNCLLIGLARCDTVLILTSMMLFGLPAVYAYTGLLFDYYYLVYPRISPYVYPIAMIAQTASVYITLTVTLERFVAVCHPLKARALCTYGRARLMVLAIIAFSVLYNLPRFWEVASGEYIFPERNMTVYCVEASALRWQPRYITLYIHWAYLVFLYFIPFISLAALNARIYRQIRRANRERQRLSRSQRREIGLATMLLCVVIVFFICNFPALVTNILEAFYNIIEERLIKTSNMLVTVNSSVNFIIYVIFGEKFKRMFIYLFCSPVLLRNKTSSRRGSLDYYNSPRDDSFVSSTNGGAVDRSLRLVRCNTGVTSATNGGNSVMLDYRDPGPCVYYPARDVLGTGKGSAC